MRGGRKKLPWLQQDACRPSLGRVCERSLSRHSIFVRADCKLRTAATDCLSLRSHLNTLPIVHPLTSWEASNLPASVRSRKRLIFSLSFIGHSNGERQEP